MNSYRQIISRFKGKKILVIGDIILDEYIRGNVSRISPEAPVPVVHQDTKPSYTPGGAANVANNLSHLGAKVSLVGIIGRDAEGKLLIGELKKRKIKITGVFVDPSSPTILKTRVITQHQQVVRIDRERIREGGNSPIAKKIQKYVLTNLSKFDAVIISDYGKGVITPALIKETCRLALQKNKIITVDPKVEHFGYYTNVTAITPNKREAENAIQNIKITEKTGHHLKINTHHLEKDDQINKAGLALLKYLRLETLLMTLGEHGMRLFEKGRKPVYINTKAQDVFDVSGAGDTVISVFTLSLVAGATKRQAADLSNHAAGIVVGKTGAVPVETKELITALKA